MKLASFNVNSIRIRLPAVVAFLETHQPDLLVLQELKATAEQICWDDVRALGYAVEAVTQISYNGVAVISKIPFQVRATQLPQAQTPHITPHEDGQARYLEVGLETGEIIVGLYAPNGNPVWTDGENPSLSEKFLYKCQWYDRLIAHVQSHLLPQRQPLALLGDFNIVPTARDIYANTLTDDDATTHLEARRRYASLRHLGLEDSWQALYPKRVGYTYWDYKAGRWDRDEGLRIDLILLDGHLSDRLSGVGIDVATRSQPRPSDHAPIWVELNRS